MIADFSPGAFSPKHFLWSFEEKTATITLNRTEKKNPLTFDSYAELRDTFLALRESPEVKVLIFKGAGGNFCSGGDVHEIIGPLVNMEPPELKDFTRMTGDLIKAMIAAPQIIISSVDGICAGAGAAIAMASDLRVGSRASRVAFLFSKVGLAGCDMGSCSMLPRIIGHGRAAELLYTGRFMTAEEAFNWGFYNRLCQSSELEAVTFELARELASGPTFAHSMTKRMLEKEWAMEINDAVDAEAEAQAVCMLTNDFRRAYEAFTKKEKPVFKGD